MTRLRSLIKEVLSQPKKKDCNCGCNDCGDKAPVLTEGKVKHLISEGLQYHMDKKIQLHESVYRIGSEKHFELIREARALWVRGIIDVSEDDQAILETHLGNFGMYEGEAVPLDMPMVNEGPIDRVIGGRPYEYIGDGRKGKAIVSGPMKDREKETIIKRAEKAGYIAKPNMGGGVTIFIESVNEEEKDRFADSDPKAGSTIQGTGFDWEKNEEIEVKKSIKDIEDGDVILYKGKEFKVDYIDPWSAGGRILNITDLKSGKKGKLKVKFVTSKGSTGTASDTMLTVLKKSVDEGFYSSPSDLEDSGLNVIPKDQIHANKLQDALENSGLYGEWNPREGYFFFPEKEDGYDQLEMEIQELMDDYNIQGYIEGVFEESLNEGQDKWVVYDIKTKKRLPNAGKIYKDRKAAQAFADKQENAKVASDTFYFDKIQEKESVDEVDRYSGFNRNPEDPDSEPFIPTGAVAEFKEELRALFGKFKGDLKNPEFIKGVAEIMVNWKALLRSQLDEAKKKKKKKKKDPPLNKPKRGGSKAYYVYVRDPKTKKIKKVSFGSGGLRAKIKNKEARNAFAARHNCKNKKDRTKAGYWSCNLPRYAEQLGLGSKMNTFW